MIVKKKIKTHFLNLLEDREFANIYFSFRNFGEYNKDKLNELQSDLKTSKKLWNKLASKLSSTRFLKIINLEGDISEIEKQHMQIRHSVHELDIFRSDLAYLLFSGILDIEKTQKLGFDSEFIKELLSEYKMQLLNPYIEYHYNEETGITSEITENGKMIILSYTPDVVKDALREKCKDEYYY